MQGVRSAATTVGAWALLLVTLLPAAAAQVEDDGVGVPTPAAAEIVPRTVGSPWTLSGQVRLGFYERGGEVGAVTDEIGLRLSRAFTGRWRLGLALARDAAGHGGPEATYLDLGLEHAWDVNDRLRLVALGGVSAGRLSGGANAADSGTGMGGHAGLAIEVRLTRELLLRPEVRHRFLDGEEEELAFSGGASLGLGWRF